jgi:hypothetical protein
MNISQTSRSKLTSKDVNAILKKKTHKVHMNNAPSKVFKKYGFGGNFLKKQL